MRSLECERLGNAYRCEPENVPHAVIVDGPGWAAGCRSRSPRGAATFRQSQLGPERVSGAEIDDR
jgi:hypothetical protein